MEQLEQYWQFGAALIFVLALIGILFWVLQKIGVGGGKGRRGTRLGIVEAAVVDKKRRLVLIRRDSVEHLVMIGGPQDLVVENNISRREPSLAAGKPEPSRGAVIPELAVRAVERSAASAQPAAAPESRRPEPVVAAAAIAPEPPQEKPLPHPEEPVRRASAPAAVPEEAASCRREEAVAGPGAGQAGGSVRRRRAGRSGQTNRTSWPPPRRRGAPGGTTGHSTGTRPAACRRGAADPRSAAAVPGGSSGIRTSRQAMAAIGRPLPRSAAPIRGTQRYSASDERRKTSTGRRAGAGESAGATGRRRRRVERHVRTDSPREVSQQDGSPREPANLNLRPGEDR